MSQMDDQTKEVLKKELFMCFTFQFRIFSHRDNRPSALAEISAPDEPPFSPSHDLQTPGVVPGTA